VFPDLSVQENPRLGALAVGAKVDKLRRQSLVFDYLPRLAERRSQPAGTLSGGEQQMLAVGRGLTTPKPNKSPAGLPTNEQPSFAQLRSYAAENQFP